MNKFMRHIVLWIMLVGISTVNAQIAYEGFDANMGGQARILLDDLSTGYGWASVWNVQNSPTAIPGYNVADTGGLSYSTLKATPVYATGGDSWVTSARGLDVATDGMFADYITGGMIGKPGTTLWFSVLIRSEDGDRYKTGFKDNGTNWGGDELVLIKNNSGNWEIDGSLLGSPVSIGQPVVQGQVEFIVMKIEFGSSDANLSIYWNPSSLGGAAPATPDATATTNAALEFDCYRFYPGSGPDDGSIDEIRFGKTYADVTPIVRPTMDEIADPLPIYDNDPEQTLNLTGISDGVGGGETISITATSETPAVIADPTVVYSSPNNTGQLKYTPLSVGEANIIVTVSASNVPNDLVDSFKVEVQNSAINYPPLIDGIGNKTYEISEGTQVIELTGISDGDQIHDQAISITATSSDHAVAANPVVTYTSGDATGSLQITPEGGIGITTIAVTLTDDATGTTSGDNDTTITFDVDFYFKVRDPQWALAYASFDLAGNIDANGEYLDGTNTELEDYGFDDNNKWDSHSDGSKVDVVSAFDFGELITTESALIPGGLYTRKSLDLSGAFAEQLSTNGMVGKGGTTLWASCLITKPGPSTLLEMLLSQNSFTNSAVGAGPYIGFGYVSNSNMQGIGISAHNPYKTEQYNMGQDTVILADTYANAPDSAFFVIKIEFDPAGGENGGTVSFWYNPDPASYSVAPPTAPDAVYTDTVDFTFQHSGFYGKEGIADELRIGPTWKSVTPIATPTIDPITNPETMWDLDPAQSLYLSGISDGVGGSETITVSATSTDPAIVDPAVTYTSPNDSATITYEPVNDTNGVAWVIVEITASNVPGVAVDSFYVEVKSSKINHAPTIDPVIDRTVLTSDGEQTITLEGIDDGDYFFTQDLSFAATSNDPAVVGDPSIDYTQGESTAILRYTPAGTARTATITLTVTDDANGTPDGGDNDTVITFNITTMTDFSGIGWIDEFEDGTNIYWENEYSIVEEDGMMKVSGPKRTKWISFGTTLGTTVDITSNQTMSMDVRTGDLAQPFTITAYVEDENDNRETVTKRVTPSENFTTISLEYSKPEVDFTKINTIFFAINGNNLTWNGEAWFDEIALGHYAKKVGNLSPVDNKAYYINTGTKEILLTDIENVDGFSVTGGESLIENVAFSSISNGQCTMSFDLQTDASGVDTIHLIADGSAGYYDNELTFELQISDNFNPTIDDIADIDVETGEAVVVELENITDGDRAVEQPLTITAVSDNPTATGPLSIDYKDGYTKGKLNFTPANAATNITVTVTLDDGQAANNLTQKTFNVNIYDVYNNPPSMYPVVKQDAILTMGTQQITLLDIQDGDDAGQNISISATSSVDSVVDDADLSVSYSGGTQGTLSYTPSALGTTTISLTLTDDGGDGSNNGDASKTYEFDIEVINLLPTGYVYEMQDIAADKAAGLWGVGGMFTSISYGTFHGYSNTTQIVFQNKSNWDAIVSDMPGEYDFSENPYISFDLYSEGQPMYFHIYFYDYTHEFADNPASTSRNVAGAHAERVMVPADTWTHVVFDYTPEGYLANGDGEDIVISRIDHIMMNMHPEDFPFPFTSHDGTVYIRNLKLGDQVDFGNQDIVATIDPVADQNFYYNASPTEQTINLSGISDGNETTNVTLSTDIGTSGIINSVNLSSVETDGTAKLTFTPGNIGTTTVDVIVDSPVDSIVEDTAAFKVSVLSNNPGDAVAVNVYLDSIHQTWRGMGSMVPEAKQADAWSKDMRGTAFRMGMLGSDTYTSFEMVNDNDDPDVMDLSNFNRSIQNWNTIRKLIANGAETFYVTWWSPEDWMKDNLSVDMGAPNAQTNTDATTNRLSYYMYDEFAEHVAAYCKVFYEETGKHITAIGLQNEPAFHEPYGSAILDPSHFVELTNVVAQRLIDEGIPTRFGSPEQVISQGANSMAEYTDAFQADEGADTLTKAICTHGYAQDGVGSIEVDGSMWKALRDNAQEGPNPKEVWLTETGVEAETWDKGIVIASGIYNGIENGDLCYWTSFSSTGQLFEKTGEKSYSYYVYKHYSFIRPGAQRVSSNEAEDNFFITTFQNEVEDGGNTVSVVINNGELPKTLNLSYLNGTAPDMLDVYTSTEMDMFNNVATGIAVDSIITIPANSVSTVVGYSAASLINVTVNSGSGDGSYAQSSNIDIQADDLGPSKKFFKWTGDVNGVDDVFAENTSLVVPGYDITVTAEYTDVDQYTLTVNGGVGSGSYYEGETIEITAGDSSANYREFSVWTGDDVYVSPVGQAVANVTMPAQNITVNATYSDMTGVLVFEVFDTAGTMLFAGIEIEGEQLLSGQSGEPAYKEVVYGEYPYGILYDGDIVLNDTAVIYADSLYVRDTINTADDNDNSIANPSASCLSAYPNPTTGIININSDIEIQSVTVMDITGKQVMYTEEVNNTINIAKLEDGIYFLKIIADDEEYDVKIYKIE